MAKLHPFRALRPLPNVAPEVAAVPYDVVNRQEAFELAKGKPLSLLLLAGAEFDLAADVDPSSPHVYARANENLDSLTRQALIRDERPCLYGYRLKHGLHQQTGISATYSIDEYDS